MSCVVFGNILAILDYLTGLKLAFVVTKFPLKVQVKGLQTGLHSSSGKNNISLFTNDTKSLVLYLAIRLSS